MRKLTLTIAIPAFNEEKNIQKILADILIQNKRNFVLKNILVVSDGSTDETVKKVKQIKNKLISVLKHITRAGVAVRQNQIMKITNSDVLVLLDSDISIKDPLFLEKLIKPFQKGNTDLVSVKVLPIPPPTFIGKILAFSVEYKNNVFYPFNNGDNWYTCHGRARGFSRKLYKKIHFKSSAGQDLYSYLYAKNYGYNYKFVGSTEVYYLLPENLTDHQRQSLRFFKSSSHLGNEFSDQFVNKMTSWPTGRMLIQGLSALIFHPLLAASYLFLSVYIFLKSKLQIDRGSGDKWAISPSTKKQII